MQSLSYVWLFAAAEPSPIGEEANAINYMPCYDCFVFCQGQHKWDSRCPLKR